MEEHLAGTEPQKRRTEMELREAVLLEPVNHWPAGTRGTIVDAFEHEAVVEVTDSHGAAVALLSLPYAVLSVLPERAQTHSAL